MKHEDKLLNIIKEALHYADDSGIDDEHLEAMIPDMFDESAKVLVNQLKTSARAMLEEHETLRQGFEHRLREIWGKAIDMLEMFQVISLEAGGDFNKEFRTEAVQDQDFVFDVLTRLHARACQVTDEVITLLKAGFADGAHARWRTLCEIAVIATFIKKQGQDVAERYCYYDDIEAYNNVSQLGKDRNGSPTVIFTDQEIHELKAIYDALIERFGKTYVARDYGWASKALNHPKPSFKMILRSVNLSGLELSYSLACHNIHAGPKGITFKLGMLPLRDNPILLAGASYSGLGLPGYGAAASLYQVTDALLRLRPNFDRLRICKTLGLILDNLHEAFDIAQKEVDRRTVQELDQEGRLP